MKSKILLCDANFSVLPILESIINKNNNVSVVGSRLHDPAHSIADSSIPLDYSDIDALLEHVKQHNYNCIVPGCNDRSYLTLSKIAETLDYVGFDKYDTVLTIHHKDRFREFSEEKNYPVPKAVRELGKINSLRFPVIIKPIDSYSGKGVYRVENIKDVEFFWHEAAKVSTDGKVIAEEFIDGKLFSHSAFIKNKKIVVDFFVNEYCTVYPYQVNSSNISTTLNYKIQEKVKEWVEQFSQDLDLCDGLVHTQFISDRDEFMLIEVARRCPGDLYSELIKKGTGIDYAELYTLPFLGLELPDQVSKKFNKFISRHTVSVNQECIFISSSVDLQCKTIEGVPLKYSGDSMKAAPYDKSGIYFIEHHSAEDMEELTEELKNHIKVDSLSLN